VAGSLTQQFEGRPLPPELSLQIDSELRQFAAFLSRLDPFLTRLDLRHAPLTGFLTRQTSDLLQHTRFLPRQTSAPSRLTRFLPQTSSESRQNTGSLRQKTGLCPPKSSPHRPPD
jgi:hypothetical protein